MTRDRLKIISRIIYAIYAVVFAYLFLQSSFLNIAIAALSLIGIIVLVRLNKI